MLSGVASLLNCLPGVFVMSCSTAWIVALLILIGSVWSQRVIFEDEAEEPSPRFGFDFLESLRKSFCRGLCSSPDTMSYVMSLACATKCPELYLPQRTTTTSTVQPSSPSMTPNLSTPTQSTPTPTQSTPTPTQSTPTPPPNSPSTQPTMPTGSTSTQQPGSGGSPTGSGNMGQNNMNMTQGQNMTSP